MSDATYLLVEHADGEVYYEVPDGGEGIRQRTSGDLDERATEGWAVVEDLAHDATLYNVDSIAREFTPFGDSEDPDG